jgi:hypothetical protein
MSIDRSDDRRSEAARVRHQQALDRAERVGNEQHRAQQVSAESVDRFRAALQRQAEPPPPKAPRTGQQSETSATNRQNAVRQEQQGLANTKTEQSKLTERLAAQGQESESAERQAAVSQRMDDHEIHRKGGGRDASSQSDSSTDVASLWQAQMALRGDAGPPPTAPTPVNTQVFAELIQRHVRQMAASDSADKHSDGQVLLRMSDSTLPGTDLLLSKTATGWVLRADSRSRDSYDAIRRAAPELAKRFADSELGELVVDPHFHD